MNDKTGIISKIEKRIIQNFPTINVLTSYDSTDDEYFIGINNSEIFHSESYQNI